MLILDTRGNQTAWRKKTYWVERTPRNTEMAYVAQYSVKWHSEIKVTLNSCTKLSRCISLSPRTFSTDYGWRLGDNRWYRQNMAPTGLNLKFVRVLDSNHHKLNCVNLWPTARNQQNSKVSEQLLRQCFDYLDYYHVCHCISVAELSCQMTAVHWIMP